MMHRTRTRGRSRAATAIIETPVRCAIYTRKSTDEGLDRDFNSLDNQRERAEAFADSQGWTALPDRYDDGGFSGGTIERPDLKRLLTDVEAGKINTVVCYRLDRISRSLVDFVKIHEFLEKHGVALVSVTESINTTTPHGRMMVNVLLSFAQYERELIAERTRHKIQAARRHGKWTGGMPPLGYDASPEGGKLVVNKDEADQVKAIYAMYAENPSLISVSQELNRRGWRRKSWTTKKGTFRQGKEWDRKTLRDLLRNPLYAGLQKLGDETFPGEHRRIVPKKLFDRIQRLLDQNLRTGGSAARNSHGALLRGLLRCTACDAAMTFTPARKNGKLYRYYRCQSAQKKGANVCPTRSVNADQIEAFVVDRIKVIGSDLALQEETFRQAIAQLKAEKRGLKAEAKRLERDLTKVGKQTEKLVTTLTDSQGAARHAVSTELEKAQQHIETLETRLGEIRQQQASMDSQTIDQTDLAGALEAFDPIWDVLLTPERERVIKLLIESVRYDGGTGNLKIDFRMAGIAEMAQEVGGAA